MITEDYVSFETAKLLKEKGFDEYNPLWYNLDKPIEGPFFYKEIGWFGHNSYSYAGRNIISAPTLQMAMKWLREVHKINIEIITYWTKDKSMVYGNRIVHNDTVLKEIDTAYNSYEESCEVAIKYSLENLI